MGKLGGSLRCVSGLLIETVIHWLRCLRQSGVEPGLEQQLVLAVADRM